VVGAHCRTAGCCWPPGSDDGTARVWDPLTDDLVATLTGRIGSVLSPVVVVSERFLALESMQRPAVEDDTLKAAGMGR